MSIETTRKITLAAAALFAVFWAAVVIGGFAVAAHFVMKFW